MQVTCLCYAPEKKGEPGAEALYQIAQRVFDTLPPLSVITQYHRNPVFYKEWTARHREVMAQGLNRGMSSTYDYDLYPLIPSDFTEIRLHVTGCPLYEEWEAVKRPGDWQTQIEQEQAYCSFVCIKTQGWSAPETIRYNKHPLTSPQMTAILDHVLEASLPVTVQGSPDNIRLSSLLTVKPDQIRKQVLPNGMIHWLCTIREPDL